MASPRRAATIDSELRALATAHPGVCSITPLPNASRAGQAISCLRITAGPAGRKPVVLVIGGVHAREWAPPDALLTFSQRLVTAYAAGGSVAYPVFTDSTAAPPIPYAAFTIPAADVKAAVETLEIYVLPTVNPDGRDFSLTPGNAMWRKNRRPHPAMGASIGVDINRNFDIAWDVDRYYSTGAMAADASIARVKTAADETYHGDAPASEPETKNVAWLVNTKGVAFFCDVHMFGRKILYPWSIESDQTVDATKSFTNANWDRGGPLGGRDGTSGTRYEEFFPNTPPARPLDDHVTLGTRMRDAIVASAGADARASARSAYKVEPSIAIGYVSPGASDDYTFSRLFAAPPAPYARVFTIECGSDLDGEHGFHPDYTTKYPKIEREVHAALHAFLKEAVARAPAVLGSAPAPAPPPVPPSSTCALVVMLAAAGLYAEIDLLKTERDLLAARPGPAGATTRFVLRLCARPAAALAGHLQRHPLILRLARRAIALPLVGAAARRRRRRVGA